MDISRYQNKIPLTISSITDSTLSHVRKKNWSQVQLRSALTKVAPMQDYDRSPTLLNDEQKQKLLDSLKFAQIDARQMTIKTAYAKTCRWLLKNDQYLQWDDKTRLVEHHGFLWIRGNPGTGKSTLMKFAFTHARKAMKDRMVLSFFFNARGEEMEKSTAGVYRSLLIQLLERVPKLQTVFDSLGLSKSKISADYQWTVESLQVLLEQAIMSLENLSVVCFIDALDECHEEQVRDMVQFFEQIGESAVSTGIRFQVCFSSRHYPHISLRYGLELVLEGQEGHTQDITNYVEKELKIGKSKTAQQIRVELQEKASGIFMWVVLVVGILNKESDQGQAHRLRRKLQEIPGDLHELFRDLLTRDTHNKNELILCIQWILYSKQPLSPEQLYHAILSDIELEAVTAWDPEEITKDVVKRFILNSSKGLAETTVSKSQKVQFIHESVRDFLLKENGLAKIWPEYGTNFEGQSHNRLKQCCMNYTSLDFATLKIPNDLPKASTQEASDLRTAATRAFPFLEYAVHNVLRHAEAAESGGISQATFLENFRLSQWVKLDNLFEKHEIRKHTEHVSILYILAELNMPHLIRALDSTIQCTNKENERYGCSLFAAFVMNNEEVFELFMASVDMNQADIHPNTAWKDYQYRQESSKRTSMREFVYSKSKGLLRNAVELGHERLLVFLIRSGMIKTDPRDSRDKTALWYAIDNSWTIAVKSLLDLDATIVSTRIHSWETPLYVAVERDKLGIVKLLLEKGANVDEINSPGGTALQAAISRGHKDIVALLLEKGADVNKQSESYGTALQAAISFNKREFVKMLLDHGADVNTQGGRYNTALQAAACSIDRKEIVEMLLNRGANVNAQGGHYNTALQAACTKYRNKEEVVKMLLNHGAEVNAQGGEYGNALQAACTFGSKEVVEMLLNHGADVYAQGGQYDNALDAALHSGHEEIAALLRSWGALQRPDLVLPSILSS